MIRDVIQAAGLEGFAEIGVVLFVLAFSLILITTYFGLKPGEIDALRRAPLDPEEAPDE